MNWGYPQEFKAADTVAYVYIVSYTDEVGSSGATGYGGHTFLAVKNLTDDKLTIGHYNLGGNHIMSIGSWGNIPDGNYTYYNIEKYRMVNGVYTYTPSVYVRAEVTANQISKLST